MEIKVKNDNGMDVVVKVNAQDIVNYLHGKEAVEAFPYVSDIDRGLLINHIEKNVTLKRRNGYGA